MFALLKALFYSRCRIKVRTQNILVIHHMRIGNTVLLYVQMYNQQQQVEYQWISTLGCDDLSRLPSYGREACCLLVMIVLSIWKYILDFLLFIVQLSLDFGDLGRKAK